MSDAPTILSPEGPIARALPSYKFRPSQIEMARAVEEVTLSGGVLLAEAGTGTGKTLAYLIPVILSARTSIVSTGTKNLQEQVFFKDIDFIKRALGRSINAVYLKGQDNYLCLRRFRDFLKSPAVLKYKPERVEEIMVWARETETGDRMELEELPDDDAIWHEICSTRETRIGSKCPFFNDCFVTQARLRASRADIVVVNHHLYFADVATRQKGGSLLPRHDVLILDEAHGIENVATEFFSVAVASGRVERLLADIAKTMGSAKLADDPDEERRDKLISHARAASARLFDRFRGSLGKERLVPEELGERAVEAYHRLDTSLEAVQYSLRIVEGRDEAVDHVAGRVAELRDDLGIVLTRAEKGFVHWMENKKRSVWLGASPIDVSNELREGIFFKIPSVVLTSATLSVGGDFTFLKARLGLDFDVTELCVSSPFDYEKQACLYLPTSFPDPRSADFVQEAGEEVIGLIEITGGGALILCTSVANMRALHGALVDRVPGRLLLQGNAPKSRLLADFSEHAGSVLCATMSFWQGVDLPGDALRLVIIDKLPFSSPGDPLEAARIASLTENGKNAFKEYQVPSAALLLKQGFGRLIRTERDRGIVAVLDKRISTMSYGKSFLKSLPPCPQLGSLADVAAWYGAARLPT